MKIERITFMQTFPTGQYANQKLAVEIEIESPDPSTGMSNWDAAMDAFKEGKELVNKAFEKMNPGLVYDPSWPSDIKQSVHDEKAEAEISHQFEITKGKVTMAKTKEDAIEFMREAGFSLNVELKEIANSKPNKK